MFKIIGFILLFLLIISFVLFAEQTESLKFFSSVDKTEVNVGEVINFKITIEGNFRANPKIEIPKLEEDFEIVSRTQSQRVSWEKGKKNSAFVWKLMLLAKRPGKLSIAVAKLKLGSKVYTTRPIEITVKEGIPQEKPKGLEKEFPDYKEGERITL